MLIQMPSYNDLNFKKLSGNLWISFLKNVAKIGKCSLKSYGKYGVLLHDGKSETAGCEVN